MKTLNAVVLAAALFLTATAHAPALAAAPFLNPTPAPAGTTAAHVGALSETAAPEQGRRRRPGRPNPRRELLTLAQRFGRSHAAVRMRAKRIGARSRTTRYGKYGDYTWVNAAQTDAERLETLDWLDIDMDGKPVNEVIAERSAYIDAWEKQDAARKSFDERNAARQARQARLRDDGSRSEPRQSSSSSG